MAKKKRKIQKPKTNSASSASSSNRTLDTKFHCPFCNSFKSCSVKLDFSHNIGKVNCSRCPATFSSSISRLSHAVDVYSDWIDACEMCNTA
ncbi:MAG: Transcription elongation factor 1 [Marteilia pararefringens]